MDLLFTCGCSKYIDILFTCGCGRCMHKVFTSGRYRYTVHLWLLQVHAHPVQHDIPAAVWSTSGDCAQGVAGGSGLLAWSHCRCTTLFWRWLGLLASSCILLRWLVAWFAGVSISWTPVANHIFRASCVKMNFRVWCSVCHLCVRFLTNWKVSMWWWGCVWEPESCPWQKRSCCAFFFFPHILCKGE